MVRFVWLMIFILFLHACDAAETDENIMVPRDHSSVSSSVEKAVKPPPVEVAFKDQSELPIPTRSDFRSAKMEKAFTSVFGKAGSIILQLPHMQARGKLTGKQVPFLIRPLDFMETAQGGILLTAAETGNDSAQLDPNSDMYYSGVYYLRRSGKGYRVKASFPTAIWVTGSAWPLLTAEYTCHPILVAMGGFTHMGSSRDWREFYTLDEKAPSSMGRIPLSCEDPVPGDWSKTETTEGKIKSIQVNRSISVEYKGDRSGLARWSINRGRLILDSPYPDICSLEDD